MTPTPQGADWFRDSFERLTTSVGAALLGRPHEVRLAVTCLVTGGHLLIEDNPGTGKTMLAKAMARSVHGSHSRIQFTPDLLPRDITGVDAYNQHTGTWTFHEGPVFANVVLADEINRASPKTQSALLQAMEEAAVSSDRTTYPLPKPFMVIATQNPVEQAGTYPLPEAQLDRFLMKTTLGYPDLDTTVSILEGSAIQDRSAAVGEVLTADALQTMADVARGVTVARAVLQYAAQIAEATRPPQNPWCSLGVSVRGTLALVRAAKTWAAADGRAYVTPDDIKDLALPVLAHRLVLTPEAQYQKRSAAAVLGQALASVDPPVRAGV